MPRPMKECRSCGNLFEQSAQDATVNCPSCRKSRYRVGEKKVTVSGLQKYYLQGYTDGKKADKSKSKLSNYRNSAFSLSHDKTRAYEAGFNDAWMGYPSRPELREGELY